MKKAVSILLAAFMAGSLLAGCGASGNTAASSDESQTENTVQSSVSGQSTVKNTEESSKEAGAETSDSGDTAQATETSGKTLVVYFSASGNTENIAKEIANSTGADLYAITPAEPYTDDDLDWTNDDSRVNKEHEDTSLQNVEISNLDVPDWDSYTTVFVGYPIWWGDASWVVKSFVSQEDFTGKTVIPFCTSSSSPIGDSGKNLEELAGTGTWLEGERFSGGASQSEVDSWIESLNL